MRRKLSNHLIKTKIFCSQAKNLYQMEHDDIHQNLMNLHQGYFQQNFTATRHTEDFYSGKIPEAEFDKKLSDLYISEQSVNKDKEGDCFSSIIYTCLIVYIILAPWLYSEELDVSLNGSTGYAYDDLD